MLEPAAVTNMRILLVGSKASSLIMRQVLGILGVKQVVSIEEFSAAVEQLCVERYAAVFCDDDMSNLDGQSFANAARRNVDAVFSMVPIFLVSPRLRKRDVEAARDVGYTDVLAKPVSAATVLKKLNAAIVTPRPFIASTDFFGPDRRAPKRPEHRGGDRRIRQPRKVRVAVPAADNSET